jgi:hypothetical protein
VVSRHFRQGNQASCLPMANWRFRADRILDHGGISFKIWDTGEKVLMIVRLKVKVCPGLLSQ